MHKGYKCKSCGTESEEKKECCGVEMEECECEEKDEDRKGCCGHGR